MVSCNFNSSLKVGEQQQDARALDIDIVTFQKQRVTPGAKASPNGVLMFKLHCWSLLSMR